MISSLPKNKTFMATQRRTMNKLSWLMKYWISFTYQQMSITIVWQIHINHPIPVLWTIIFKQAGVLGRLTRIYSQCSMNIKQLLICVHIYVSLGNHALMQWSKPWKFSIKNKCNSYEQMKVIAQAYASNWECSEQKAVYHWPELWLRKVFLCVI